MPSGERRLCEPQGPPVDQVTIAKPQILTGPKHLTVDEATVSYLREAAARVRDKRYWGSGVSALVSSVLDDVADAMAPERTPDEERQLAVDTADDARAQRYEW